MLRRLLGGGVNLGGFPGLEGVVEGRFLGVFFSFLGMLVVGLKRKNWLKDLFWGFFTFYFQFHKTKKKQETEIKENRKESEAEGRVPRYIHLSFWTPGVHHRQILVRLSRLLWIVDHSLSRLIFGKSYYRGFEDPY